MARRAAGIKIDIGANVATLTTDLGKATKTLKGFEKDLYSFGKGFQRILGGLSVGAAIAGSAVAVKKFSDTVLELAEAGDQAAGIQDAFEKLGGSAEALDEATKRSQGLIEKFDLMKAANEGLIRGIPNLNKHLGDLADLATRFADAKGLNPTEVFSDLIDAVASGKAKSLEKFGFDLSQAKGEAQNTAGALNQLTTQVNRFNPVSLGAGDAVDILKNSLSTLRKEIAIGVDSSDDLRFALLTLSQGANSKDLRDFGKALGDLEAILLRLAASVLPSVTTKLNQFIMAWNFVRIANKVSAPYDEIKNLEEKLKQLRKVQTDTFSLSGAFVNDSATRESARQQALELEKQIAEKRAALKKMEEGAPEERRKQLKEEEDQRLKDLEELLKREQELRNKYGFNPKNGEYNPPASGEDSAKKAADNLEKKLKITGDNLRTNIENAIETINPEAFSFFKDQIFKNTQEAYILANQQLVKDRVITEEELGTLARAEAEKTVDDYESRMKDAQDRLGEQMKQAHEDAVSSWTSVFERIFDPGSFDPTASAKELATGFLSELMAGLAGGLGENATSFYGMGRIIAAGLTDGASAGLRNIAISGGGGSQSSGAGWGAALSGAAVGGWMASQSGGMSFSGTAQTAAQNAEWNAAATAAGGGAAEGASSGGAASWAGYAAAGLQVVGAAAGSRSTDKATDSNAGTGAAIGAGIGAAIGAIWGPIGSMIGAQIGQIGGALIGGMFKWGPQNPDTKARHAFANFIEEGFQKLSRVSFFDAEGIVRSMPSRGFNFLEGPQSRFNPNSDTGGTDWGQNFQAMGDDVLRVFDGLGQAFEEMLGLTEDVGGQIGYLLATNFAGNIDNARLLVAQLGLSLEDMTNALVEAGRTGEMTWLEVEVALQGVNAAFGEGLVAVGDIGGAFNEFIGSAGRGIAAIKGVRDLAIETLEKGGSSLQDLRNQLIQVGANPEVVDALINAIRGRGINSLEELRNANERVLGGIVADTNSSSQALQTEWAAVEDKINSIRDQLGEIDANMLKNLTINVTTNLDDATKDAMEKGLFTQTPVESFVSQPIQTPQTKSARYRQTVPNTSNVSQMGTVTMNIDARGAERGVQNDILNSMAIMEKRIMTRTMDLVHNQILRGAL